MTTQGRTTSSWWLVACVALVSGCASMTIPTPPGARHEDSKEGPAYFTEARENGIRYTHNWVQRPCFEIEMPGHDWVLQEATSDYVLWRKGHEVLKLYLTDNRDSEFAVSGMNTEDALRAFVGFELDFVRPKFDDHRSSAPSLRRNENGQWALWRWEGHGGRRAGVGKSQPADQRHRVASLWIDPWVLSFDWATVSVDTEDNSVATIKSTLESLKFHPECFRSMRAGETWGEL